MPLLDGNHETCLCNFSFMYVLFTPFHFVYFLNFSLFLRVRLESLTSQINGISNYRNYTIQNAKHEKISPKTCAIIISSLNRRITCYFA